MTTTTMPPPTKPLSAGTSAGPCAGFFTLVPDVPGLLRLAQARARASRTQTASQILAFLHIYTRHIRHIRHILVFYRKNGKRGGTVAGTKQNNPAQHQNLAKTTQTLATRTIRTTPENAAQVQQLVKNDPALLGLVQSLQANGLFPGLRAISFTLTGTPEHCAKGLAAWAETNPTKATPC